MVLLIFCRNLFHRKSYTSESTSCTGSGYYNEENKKLKEEIELSFGFDRLVGNSRAMLISESVMESELFGHVKGAFTGAYTSAQGLIRSAERTFRCQPNTFSSVSEQIFLR